MEDAPTTQTERERPAAAPTTAETDAMARAAALDRRDARGLRLLAWLAAAWFGFILGNGLPVPVPFPVTLGVLAVLLAATLLLARDGRAQRDAHRAITRVAPWVERVETAAREYHARTSPDRLRAWDTNLQNDHIQNVRDAIRQALEHDPTRVT